MLVLTARGDPQDSIPPFFSLPDPQGSLKQRVAFTNPGLKDDECVSRPDPQDSQKYDLQTVQPGPTVSQGSKFEGVHLTVRSMKLFRWFLKFFFLHWIKQAGSEGVSNSALRRQMCL
jgi:hypothetical protein